VGGVALAAVVALAFAPSLRGPALWDDRRLLEAAQGLTSLREAFGAHSFGLQSAEGVGASFWRPLVTATLYLEQRAAQATGLPALGWHHGVQVLVHAAVAALTWLWLRGLLPSAARRARWGAFAEPAWWGALLWALMPLKVENVTWLSGRGDVLGWASWVIGMLALRRARGAGPRALLGLGATAAALLAKETFLVAPALLWLEVACLRRAASGARWRRTASDAALWGSALATLAYLGLRLQWVGWARGGGAAMFEQVGVVERASLVLESFGRALGACAWPWAPALLRGPIGFQAPFVLAPEPLWGGVGLVGALLLLVLVLKEPKARLAVGLLVVPLLPVLNVLPTGLEARMSDRYLYLPSLGIVLGGLLALAPLWRRARPSPSLRFVLGALVAAGLVLAVQPRVRQFTHPEQLWRAETSGTAPAASLLVLRAEAEEQAGQWRAARDSRLRAARRYGELGFAEGLPQALAAARAQVTLTGEEYAPALLAYLRSLRCLLDGQPPSAGVPFPEGGGVGLPCQGVEAEELRSSRAELLTEEWLMWLARLGQPVDGELQRRSSDARERPSAALALAWLALGQPERALQLAPRLPTGDARREVEDMARLQLPRTGPERLWLGAAYRPACAAAQALEPRPLWQQAACALAGQSPAEAQFGGYSRERLRLDPSARAALLPPPAQPPVGE